MIARNHEMVKTTTPIHKMLLEEIDQVNPFRTRREFFEVACRHYLQVLKRKLVDQQLEEACRDAADEDILENADWERAILRDWK